MGGVGGGSLFTTFFRIGLFTIGGGYAMIPLIEAKIVDEKQWISREELLDLMASINAENAATADSKGDEQ
jgi:chromate transport protein ChrA